jgi:hypothetical protein
MDDIEKSESTGRREPDQKQVALRSTDSWGRLSPHFSAASACRNFHHGYRNSELYF